MTYTAEMTKTKSAELMGCYAPTSIDARKAAADILLIATERNGYSIRSKAALSGRGIKSYGNGNYSVSDTALLKLRQSHSVECDF